MNNIENLKFVFNEKVMLRNTEKTTLAYNPETGDMYELNEVGADLFEIIKTENNMKSVFEKICSEYNVTKDDIYEDVKVFVDRMIELGIINETK